MNGMNDWVVEMGAYLTDEDIEYLTEKTVNNVLKKQNTQQMLQNQINNLRNRNMQLEHNNAFLKAEIEEFKNDPRNYQSIDVFTRRENELLKNENHRLRAVLDNIKKHKKRVPSINRHAVFVRDKYKCVECGTTPNYTPLTIDHIIPRSKGGSNDVDNLQVLCILCNQSKADSVWDGGEEILGAIK
jgi:5-methylcytosine-specific restriction endonuclease McrA